MKRTLLDAAQAVGGQLVGDDHRYAAVSTDSRTLKPGTLFVALRGPNFNGRDFVAAAAAQGAIGAVVEGAVPHALAQIVVPDALRALQQLGQAWRAEFTVPIVAVGGSNGKTTAKEMTSAILSRMGPCLATHGNLNNHIGLPLSLLRFDESAQVIVTEIGMNHAGEISELAKIAKPNIGVVTNVGHAHI